MAGRRRLLWVWRVLAGCCLALAVASLEPVAPYGLASPDAQQYAETADNLASGDGYTKADGERPRYPVGFPLLLSPFAAVGDWPDNVRVFPLVAGVTLIGLMWWAAWSLRGPKAAAVAGLICTMSPAITESTTQVLSDLPAATLIAGALLAVIHRRPVLAGVLVALSATMRLGHAVFVAAVGRRGLPAGMVILVTLTISQFWLFGGLSSYPEGDAEFGLRWLWANPLHGGGGRIAPEINVAFYPQLLLGRWGWLVPGLPLLAGAELWLWRRERVARFAATIVVANVVLYLPYFYQSDRFMLPTVVVLVVFSSTFVARLGSLAEVDGPDVERQGGGCVERSASGAAGLPVAEPQLERSAAEIA